ncbi:MAG: hypothetical protein JXR73_08430 [Candidatus Omnitrophica bacterium]|nr:hypothetical protein [Candidatus Omnitrophota bacterium]
MEWLVSFILSWWTSMGLELQIFYAIGLLATLVIFIQVLLMFFGFGMDIDDVDVSAGDVGDGGDASDGLHLLSARTITAFFLGFGWTGVIALRNSYALEVALIFAIFMGMAFMIIIFFLLKTLYSLKDSGTLDYHNAIGKIGIVYIPIPPNETGAGQVEITVQGRLRFIPAYTASSERIASKSRVKVVDLVDPQTVLVEPAIREAKEPKPE